MACWEGRKRRGSSIGYSMHLAALAACVRELKEHPTWSWGPLAPWGHLGLGTALVGCRLCLKRALDRLLIDADEPDDGDDIAGDSDHDDSDDVDDDL